VSRHVVFGTGQVGRLVVDELVSRGIDTAAVSRRGVPIPGAASVAGDATDAAFTTRVATGADVVYFCLNASRYDRWNLEFPPLQRGVLSGARAAGARLVVLENLYSYGPTGGRPLVESMPAAPTSSKAATRAAMTDELLAAHAADEVEVVIGRASDYFGPGTTQSALGENVFARAVAGRRAQVMGKPSTPHSYSYTPDVARALVTLGLAADASGEVWHLPIAETRTTRDIVERVYELAGERFRLMAAGKTTLRVLGIFQPAMRELLHTLYQFTEPWIVDDSKLRASFGDLSTPLDDGLAATVEWYRRVPTLRR
jgi:nucleoside-diphosphate-sugar epimerase